MKKVFVLITLIISIFSFSQDSKFSLGINYSPEVAYRTILKGDGDIYGVSDFYKDWLDDVQIARFGFSSGVTCQYQATEHWSIQTGIQYAEAGFKSKWFTVTSAEPNFPAEVQNRIRYRYIQMPVNVRYHFNISKLRFYAGLGVTTGYLADILSSEHIHYSDGGETYAGSHSRENMKPYSLSANALIGLKIPLSERTHLCIEPNFRYGLENVEEVASLLSYHLWNAGLNFSYQINL